MRMRKIDLQIQDSPTDESGVGQREYHTPEPAVSAVLLLCVSQVVLPPYDTLARNRHLIGNPSWSFALDRVRLGLFSPRTGKGSVCDCHKARNRAAGGRLSTGKCIIAGAKTYAVERVEEKSYR